jgi:hypothetical protein
MKEIHYITPAIGKITDDDPGGRCIEAWFYVEDGSVVLCSESGQPVRDGFGIAKRAPVGDNPRGAASNLALRNWRSARDWKDDFNRPIGASEYAKVPC